MTKKHMLSFPIIIERNNDKFNFTIHSLLGHVMHKETLYFSHNGNIECFYLKFLKKIHSEILKRNYKYVHLKTNCNKFLHFLKNKKISREYDIKFYPLLTKKKNKYKNHKTKSNYFIKTKKSPYVAWFDASFFENQKKSILSYIIFKNGEEIKKEKFISKLPSCPQQAEYLAFISLLKNLEELKKQKVAIYTDSQTIFKYHNSTKIPKNKNLGDFKTYIKNQQLWDGKWELSWRSREENPADKICKNSNEKIEEMEFVI